MEENEYNTQVNFEYVAYGDGPFIIGVCETPEEAANIGAFYIAKIEKKDNKNN